MTVDTRQRGNQFAATKVVVVDDEPYMRKVVRTMLFSIGVRDIREAPDGLAGLDLIRAQAPDVVIIDWNMPGLGGPGVVRAVRSPASFPYPNVPIIMLTGHGDRSHVIEAMKIGVNEFLLKPVSVNALRDRMISALTKPRKIVKIGDFHGSVSRQMATAVHTDSDQTIANLYLVK